MEKRFSLLVATICCGIFFVPQAQATTTCKQLTCKAPKVCQEDKQGARCVCNPVRCKLFCPFGFLRREGCPTCMCRKAPYRQASRNKPPQAISTSKPTKRPHQLWSYDTTQQQARLLTVRHGRVYALAGKYLAFGNPSRWLICLDANQGTLLWRYDAGDNITRVSWHRDILLLEHGGKQTALHSVTGKPYDKALPKVTPSPSQKPTVRCKLKDKQVSCRDASSDKALWHKSTPTRLGMLQVHTRHVCFAQQGSRHVSCLHPRTGKLLWTYPVPLVRRVKRPGALNFTYRITQNALYIGNYDGNISKVALPTPSATPHKTRTTPSKAPRPRKAQAPTPRKAGTQAAARPRALPYRSFATLEAARKAAKQANKTLLVIITSKWNWASKQFIKRTLRDPLIYPLLKRTMLVRFNIASPEGKRLMKHFRAYYLPAAFFLSPDGKERERSVLYYPARYYRPLLLAALGHGLTYDELKSAIKARPIDLFLKLKLAHRAYMRRKRRTSQRLYKLLWKKDPDNALGVGAWGMVGVARCLIRRNRFTKAKGILERFMKRFKPATPAHREASRLLLKCYKWLTASKAYKARLAQFRHSYPHDSPQYE